MEAFYQARATFATMQYAYEKTGHKFFWITVLVLSAAISYVATTFIESFLYRYRNAVRRRSQAFLLASVFFVTIVGTQLIVKTAVDAIVTFQRNATVQKNETVN